MNLPTAPFLELSFYFADKSETTALADLIHLLIKLGGKYTGEVTVHVGDKIGDKPFASITDQLLEQRYIADLNNLEQEMAAPDQRIVQVFIRNATGVSPDLSEILTYLSISPIAMKQDYHPLSIWTEGWMFSGPPTFLAEYTEYASQTGYEIYQRFQTIVEELSPSYAAIMVEQSLPCPTDLQDRINGYLFSDFFVSLQFLGEKSLNQVREIYAGAYLKQLNNGLYVSSYKYFNPEHKNLSLELMRENSSKLAKLIVYK